MATSPATPPSRKWPDITFSEIRSLDSPDGPDHLMGHSLGGWIAYAVAQELTSRG